jgi:signal transduction histidine kinase
VTIRSKLVIWYTGFLILSCLIIVGGIYYELVIEQSWLKHPGKESESIPAEIKEILFAYGIPAVLTTILGGLWLTRKALSPVKEIAAAAANISLQNIGNKLPRTENGDELDRLAEVFNTMLARLSVSFSREREFILHASHELKTPLMIMRGQIETALREQQLPPAQKELLESHLEEIVRFAALVDSLSFLAKADAGILAVNRKELQLDELVEEVIEEARILAYPRSITVNRGKIELIRIEGDHHRLRQLLLNLAENAIKHNIDGGEIRFSLSEVGSRAELRIENSGPGISSENIGKIFQPFFRVDPAHDPNREGSGLGLSIAAWIVNAHSGTIEVKSKPGVKTEVVVRFPTLPPLPCSHQRLISMSEASKAVEEAWK